MNAPLFYSLDPREVEALMTSHGHPAYRARQILDWVYGKRIFDPAQMSNLPADLRRFLQETFNFQLPPVLRTLGSNDSTQKFLLGLPDGQSIETVLIPASPALYGEPSDRRTLCVSSQVGCAYGCKFCASGLDGWTRHLTPGEIVGQVLLAEKVSGRKVNNLVFMGMGEPLANSRAVLKAVAILNDPLGLSIGARRITISTSGLVKGIRELADQPLQIRLAISLHGATDEIRDQIMPINRKHNLAELMEACRYYQARKGQRITFEYILIKDLNDAPDQAERLAKLAAPLHAKVNLIPYNQVEGLEWDRPARAVQRRFLEILETRGVPATIRLEKGHDIAAACGQLRLANVRNSTLQESISSVSSPS